MRYKNLKGKLQYKDCSKKLIKWDGKSRSKYQFTLKQFLKKYLLAHIVFEEFPVFGSRMTLDIFDATNKIGYEMQGEQHLGFHKFFQSGRRMNYLKQINRDDSKMKWCEINKIKYVEVYPDDLKKLSKEFFKNQFDVDL